MRPSATKRATSWNFTWDELFLKYDIKGLKNRENLTTVSLSWTHRRRPSLIVFLTVGSLPSLPRVSAMVLPPPPRRAKARQPPPLRGVQPGVTTGQDLRCRGPCHGGPWEPPLVGAPQPGAAVDGWDLRRRGPHHRRMPPFLRRGCCVDLRRPPPSWPRESAALVTMPTSANGARRESAALVTMPTSANGARRDVPPLSLLRADQPRL
jgi:hypothetical protein